MNVLGKSPKTTVLGILTILGALIHAAMLYQNGQPIDFSVTLTAISGGIGLIVAKDASTHSTQAETHEATVIDQAKKAS